MKRRFNFSLSSQMLAAGLAGAALGSYLSKLPFGPLSVVQQVGDLAATLFLAAGRALAIPLIFSSVVLGAVGLEPMRSLGRIAGRSLLWMVGSAGAAVVIGAGAAYALPLTSWIVVDLDPSLGSRATLETTSLPDPIAPGAWGWTALVIVSLGFAYYRNQIDEGHARLITRFCQGIEEILRPLMDRIARLAPWGVFALMLVFSQHEPHWAWRWDAFLGYKLSALLLAWMVYGALALPFALWAMARINPWSYLRKVLPAVLTAFASGSLEATLPVTMRAVRQRAHVSNRVAGVTLSLGAVMQREGMALGCAAVVACHLRVQVSGPDWRLFVGAMLTCVLLGCGAGALRTGGGFLLLFISQTGPDTVGILTGWGLGRIVAMGGAGLSVWSQACAAAIIARGEGEYWVPGAPPSSDELQRLKNELELADG